MNLGTWDVRLLYMPGILKALIPQLQQYEIHITRRLQWAGR
jgi:hypothetical protein